MELDPEKRLQQVRSLLKCDGWVLWLVPTLRERQEAIKAMLLVDTLGKKETARLRTEYQVLEAVLARPEQAQREMVKREADRAVRAGNGAV